LLFINLLQILFYPDNSLLRAAKIPEDCNLFPILPKTPPVAVPPPLPSNFPLALTSAVVSSFNLRPTGVIDSLFETPRARRLLFALARKYPGRARSLDGASASFSIDLRSIPIVHFSLICVTRLARGSVAVSIFFPAGGLRCSASPRPSSPSARREIVPTR